MLTRIRIEVSDEDSAAACSEALDRYEAALKSSEIQRYLERLESEALASGEAVNDQLGREVTDEVIEYDASLPGYKGRRVVKFTGWDTRNGKDPAPVDPESTEGAAIGKVTVHGFGTRDVIRTV